MMKNVQSFLREVINVQKNNWNKERTRKEKRKRKKEKKREERRENKREESSPDRGRHEYHRIHLLFCFFDSIVAVSFHHHHRF